MDKHNLVAQIVETLAAELAAIAAAAKSSRENAIDSEARAEDKYDTRALESSYLADGQMRVAAELREALDVYRTLVVRPFAPGEPIALTAVVKFEQRGGRALYFIGPRGGGLEVRSEGREVFVLTPQSPLGQRLLGQTSGAAVKLADGREGRVVAVE